MKMELKKVEHKRSGWESLASDIVKNDETLLDENEENFHRDPIANISTEDIVDWPTLPIPSKQTDRSEIESKLLRWLIICLRKDGYGPREIAYHLPCSPSFVVKVFTDYQNKRIEIIEKSKS
jgi:hypothetical protein